MLILAICQPIIDLRLYFPKDIIEKYQLYGDGFRAIRRDEELFEDLKKVKDYRESLGGASLNTLKMIAEKTQHKDLHFYGAVGDDKDGVYITEELKSLNIKTHLEIIKGEETARCYFLLQDNRRYMLSSLCACKLLSKQYIEENFIAADDALVYISTFFINALPNVADLVFEKLKDQILVLNLSCSKLFKNKNKELFLRFFKKSQYVVGNKDEFEALFNFIFQYEPKNIEEMLNLLSSKHGVMVCTDGANNIHYSENGICKNVKVIPLTDQFLDTCGAGDGFAAGFLYHLTNNDPLNVCVEKGSEWAHQAIIENTQVLKENEENYFNRQVFKKDPEEIK